MPTDNYPQYRDELMALSGNLAREAPDVLKAFKGLGDAAMKEGALDFATKELIAIAIGIAVRCEGCITHHVKAALDAGVERQKIIETIGVAIYMGGGPSMIYGCEAMKALKQYTAD